MLESELSIGLSRWLLVVKNPPANAEEICDIM